MSLFELTATPAEVTAADFAGRWSFCDDGWLATLALQHTGEADFTGTFASERFNEDYRVTARLAGHHGIEIVVHDFNWLPEQRYSGRLLTRSRSMIAGVTHWRDEPFGFFATRSARRSLGTYRSGVARGEDFAGGWTAYLDGNPATVTLEFDAATGVLRGSCVAGTDQYEVVGRPGGDVPYAVSLTIHAGDRTVELVGHLMSRPKNAISGTIRAPDGEFGFVMIRYA